MAEQTAEKDAPEVEEAPVVVDDPTLADWANQQAIQAPGQGGEPDEAQEPTREELYDGDQPEHHQAVEDPRPGETDRQRVQRIDAELGPQQQHEPQRWQSDRFELRCTAEWKEWARKFATHYGYKDLSDFIGIALRSLATSAGYQAHMPHRVPPERQIWKREPRPLKKTPAA